MSTSESTSEYTHVVVRDAPYYTTGPQQSRPSDGTFSAQTRVKLLDDNPEGGYIEVESEAGIVAYVANAALQPLA